MNSQFLEISDLCSLMNTAYDDDKKREEFQHWTLSLENVHFQFPGNQLIALNLVSLNWPNILNSIFLEINYKESCYCSLRRM